MEAFLDCLAWVISLVGFLLLCQTLSRPVS